MAKGKPTKQSSTSSLGSPDRATDGKSNTDYRGNSCSHTKSEQSPWWRVDLGRIYPVRRVKITNRGDCCFDRLSNFDIRVGNIDSNTTDNKL